MYENESLLQKEATYLRTVKNINHIISCTIESCYNKNSNFFIMKRDSTLSEIYIWKLGQELYLLEKPVLAFVLVTVTNHRAMAKQ